ncbi:phenylacetate--CoA ligase family protein [Micromonospora echinofusca]|uniref:phenylacetate--CoA ligase family protein n=1 Tax=Micromonospora echinofusca TaxID=47858 RepID=UPI0033FF4ADD
MSAFQSATGFRQSSFEGARSEIRFAYQNVPFYGKHLDDAGVTPDDVTTPEDLLRIPPTEKVHYRRDFPHGVLARGKTLREPLTLKSQSSGTGGERLTTITHTYSLADRMRATLQANKVLRDALAACRPHRPARYAAPNCSDVECATPFTTMADRMLPDGTLVLPVAHDLLATPAHMVDQAIAEVEQFAPHWFYADATHLAFLVRQMRARHLPPPPVTAIALTYTLVTDVARRQIRDYFGADVPMAEIVSMSELGWVTVECPMGRMHINDTRFFTEFLIGDRPAAPGQRAELVITSIGDRLLPHLRYRTGDIYQLGDGPCDCGSDLPLARHEGRYQSMVVITRGGRRVLVSPRDVNDAVAGDLPIDAYRLHQAGDGSQLFEYIVSDGADAGAALEGEVRRRLTVLLGDDEPLSVEPVSYIPSQRSGKFASCTSDLAQRLGPEMVLDE